MEESEDKTGLDKVEGELYKQDSSLVNREIRSELSPLDTEVKSEWEKPSEIDKDIFIPPPKNMDIAKKVLIASSIFFILSVSAAAFLLVRGGNTISSENVSVEISGPTTVRGGDELELNLAIANFNTIPIESAELVVEFPEGTKRHDLRSEDLVRHRETVGDVLPRQVVSKTVRAVLFGEENTEKEIKITLEYRTSASRAIIAKEVSYKILLSASPITLSFVVPDQVNTGKEIVVSVRAVSNSMETLKNVLVKLVYPSGFKFKSADPAASYLNNTWRIGDLGSGMTRDIKIKGTIVGTESETKSFRAIVGAENSGNEGEIAVPYGTAMRSLSIIRSYLTGTLAINGNSSNELVLENGAIVDGEIEIINSLPERILNAQAKLYLKGNGFDPKSISVTDGFFDSYDNSILWDGRTVDNLASIEPGFNVPLTFRVDTALLGIGQGQSLKSPKIDFVLEVSGTRVSPEGGVEKVEQTISKTAKITSDASVLSRVVYSTGPFVNRGPVPPKVGQETTYTVIWNFNNSSNSLSGATVRAVIPPYVTWIGATSPSVENISYDDVNKTIVWSLGDVGAGAGFTRASREVAFQISLRPSSSQLGMEPILIEQTSFNALDNFTNTPIAGINRPLTTLISTDPSYQNGQEIVK